MLFGDCIVLFVFSALAAFFIFPGSRHLFEVATLNAPILMAFVKFSLLATGGEVIAQRLRTKKYAFKGFGIMPKMIVWGILGIFISWAFTIFSNGVPFIFPFLAQSPNLLSKILTAFSISLFMNLIFAPWMMLIHHLTDSYIVLNHGTFPLGSFNILELLKNIDWERMWGFVFKKTIPFFWIPAHTITFLLPPQFRVLFAALLSVVLGIILGSVRRNEKITGEVESGNSS